MLAELCSVLDADLLKFYQKHPEHFHPYLWAERDDIFSDTIVPSQIDTNTFALFEEILSIRHGYNSGDAPTRKAYEYICKQLYRFFTEDEYITERLTAKTVKEILIPSIAIAIAKQTGWDATLVVASVTLILNSAIKMGCHAWCEYYEETHPEVKK